MKKISEYLEKADPKHCDFIDAFAYAIAAEEARLRDEYVLMYLKRKPWFLPRFAYDWLLGKIVCLALFKR